MGRVSHKDAIDILRLEIGRLRHCAEHPNWAPVRKRTLERCENAERTVAMLQEMEARASSVVVV